MCIYIYTYTHIKRERESIYIYIYNIYSNIYISRKKYIVTYNNIQPDACGVRQKALAAGLQPLQLEAPDDIIYYKYDVIMNNMIHIHLLNCT